jgi:FkbM family methyltransferase
MLRPEQLMRQTGTLLPDSIKQRVKTALGMPGVESTMASMKRNGFAPSIVIDIGAFKGAWTRVCKRVFPESHVLMIEPQASRLDDLRTVQNELTDVAMIAALLGESKREGVIFHESGSASSVLAEAERSCATSMAMSMTTLDEITLGTGFSKPDFLKLDVQGYELSVLCGGEKTLSSTEAILMEINLMPIYQDAPLLHDVAAFMAELDFRLYDICTFFRRPYDGALWQMDAVFVHTSSQLLASKRWA